MVSTVLVINLAEATERMAFQRAQLDHLSLPFERIEAISAKHPMPPMPDGYWESWERPMRLEERACLLSHRLAWQRVIEAGRPLLILEDDALLAATVPAFLTGLGAMTDIEHLTLETRGRKKLIGPARHDRPALRRLYQDRSGAAAYLLSPAGAHKLLSRTEHRAALADAALCATYELSSWQAMPALAIQSDRATPYGVNAPLETMSYIDGAMAVAPPRLAANSPLAKNRFRRRRILAQVRMGLRHLTCLLVAKRQLVEIERGDFDYLKTLRI
jgi:glycosyl transferase family 25